MSVQALTTARVVDNFDAALVFVAQQVARYGFDRPQVSILPTVGQPDDSHPEPYQAFHVTVAGLVPVPVDTVPTLAPWPPPKVTP